MILSKIWTGMVLIAILAALFLGRGTHLGPSVLEGAQSGVTLAISMAGAICLWSGVGKLMEVCKEKADKVDEYIAQFSHEKYADLVDVLQRYKENCKLSGKKASHT